MTSQVTWNYASILTLSMTIKQIGFKTYPINFYCTTIVPEANVG